MGVGGFRISFGGQRGDQFFFQLVKGSGEQNCLRVKAEGIIYQREGGWLGHLGGSDIEVFHFPFQLGGGVRCIELSAEGAGQNLNANCKRGK